MNNNAFKVILRLFLGGSDIIFIKENKMKKAKIIMFIIGLLTGAVIASGGFLIYVKVTENNMSTQFGPGQSFEMGDKQETPPEMPEGMGEMGDGTEPPEKPEGDMNGDMSEPPEKPSEEK